MMTQVNQSLGGLRTRTVLIELDIRRPCHCQQREWSIGTGYTPTLNVHTGLCREEVHKLSLVIG